MVNKYEVKVLTLKKKGFVKLGIVKKSSISEKVCSTWMPH